MASGEYWGSFSTHSKDTCAEGHAGFLSLSLGQSRHHPQRTGGSVYRNGDCTVQYLEEEVSDQLSSPATENGHIEGAPILFGLH